MKRICRPAVAAFLMLAGLPAASAQTSDWEKVVDAAKKEGKVVVYNAASGAPQYRAVVKDFEQKFGIKVETLDLRPSEMMERIRSELGNGRYLGDLQQNGLATLTNLLEKTDFIQPHGGVPNTENLRPEFAATPNWVPCYVTALGMLANTNLVHDDELKTWPDLLNPKWKGRILADDVRPIGSGHTMFALTYLKYGRSFSEQLKEQNLVYSRDLRESARRIARGEYAIMAPQIFGFAADLKPLPVKLVLPDDGAPYTEFDCAVMKNAPHPNAARVFINHFIDIESQITYANTWNIPVTKGAAERANVNSRRVAGAKLMGKIPPERDADLYKIAEDIFK